MDELNEIKDTVETLDEGVIRKWLSAQIPNLLSFALCVVLSILVYVVGIRILRQLRRLIGRSMEKRGIDTGVRQFTDQVVKIIGYLILIVTILNLFGVQTSSVAAAIASLGLTAGLALQSSLSNFAGGVLILLLKPFVVGDYIMEHTHNNEGTVSEITIFYTKLNTIDNKTVVIPNGTLANSSLTNYTKNDCRQLDLVVSISYDDDIKKAKELLEQVAASEPKRLPERETAIFVKELAASSVDLGIRFWVSTEDYWPIRWRTLERIKETFDEGGVTIPFQTLNVHTM